MLSGAIDGSIAVYISAGKQHGRGYRCKGRITPQFAKGRLSPKKNDTVHVRVGVEYYWIDYEAPQKRWKWGAARDGFGHSVESKCVSSYPSPSFLVKLGICCPPNKAYLVISIDILDLISGDYSRGLLCRAWGKSFLSSLFRLLAQTSGGTREVCRP